MEKNEPKKISLSTFFIILLIIVICVMGYFIFITCQSKSNISDDVKVSEEKTNEQDSDKDSGKISIEISSSSETYQLAKILEVYVENNGDAYLKVSADSNLYSKYGENIKVDTNVSNAFVAEDGQSGFLDIIFIKNDGTVDVIKTIDTHSTQEIKCEKISNVKDAVNVIQHSYEDEASGGYYYTIVDINGNVTSSTELQ